MQGLFLNEKETQVFFFTLAWNVSSNNRQVIYNQPPEFPSALPVFTIHSDKAPQNIRI